MSTAFVIVVPDSGQSYALLVVPEGVEHTAAPTMTDVRRGCLEVGADLAAQAAAQYTARLLSPAREPTQAQRVRSALDDRREAGE